MKTGLLFIAVMLLGCTSKLENKTALADSPEDSRKYGLFVAGYQMCPEMTIYKYELEIWMERQSTFKSFYLGLSTYPVATDPNSYQLTAKIKIPSFDPRYLHKIVSDLGTFQGMAYRNNGTVQMSILKLPSLNPPQKINFHLVSVQVTTHQQDTLYAGCWVKTP